VAVQPAHGTVTVSVDGTYTNTAEANYNRLDSFTYRANEGQLDSNVASVSLTVGSLHDAPEGLSNTVTTLEGMAYVPAGGLWF
jgi:hypothetical protein